MKRSSKPSVSTPGKPAGKANRREGGGQSNNLSSRTSLFYFKPDKVKNYNLYFSWHGTKYTALPGYEFFVCWCIIVNIFEQLL